MNIEIMRNTLYKAYLEDFYRFCQVSVNCPMHKCLFHSLIYKGCRFLFSPTVVYVNFANRNLVEPLQRSYLTSLPLKLTEELLISPSTGGITVQNFVIIYFSYFTRDGGLLVQLSNTFFLVIYVDAASALSLLEMIVRSYIPSLAYCKLSVKVQIFPASEVICPCRASF